MNSLEIILWLLALGAGSVSGYYTCLATNWTFFWVGILVVPVAFLLFFGLWVLFLFIWGACLKTKEERPNFSRFYYHVIYVTDATFLRVVNVSFRWHGLQKMPKDHHFVLVCNHLSNFDQMILIAALRRRNQPMAWISKPENMSFPIAGPFIHHAGFIPINRTNPIEGMKSLQKGVRYIQENQCCVGICPEGTRNKTDAVLLDFHPGSFSMAIWAKVPTVVICLKHTKEIKKRSPWRHTCVSIDVVDVIQPEEYVDKRPSDISARARAAILEDLETVY